MAKIKNSSTNGNGKINTSKKGLIALGLAAIMGASGIGGYAVGHSDKKADNSITTTTAASDTGVEEEEITYEHVMYNPYDINNEAEVKDLISKVKQATGVKLDYKLLKYFNFNQVKPENALTREDYAGLTDDEAALKISGYAPIVYEAITDGLVSYYNLKVATLANDEKNMSLYKNRILKNKKNINRVSVFTLVDKNSPAYTAVYDEETGLTYQEAMDSLFDKELDDILNGNIKEYSANAKEFADLVRTFYADKKVKNEDKILVTEALKGIYMLFAEVLQTNYKEDYEFLSKEFQNHGLSFLYSSVMFELGFLQDTEYTDCFEKTKIGKEYNAEDAKKAGKLAKAFGNNTEASTSVIKGKTKKSGGKHKTSQRKVQEGTTGKKKKTKEKHTEGVTEGTVTVTKEDGGKVKIEVTTDKNGNGHGETKVTGGKEVSTTVKTETTHVITEEDVQPGQEQGFIHFVRYVDLDGFFNNLGSSFTKK